MDTEMMNLKGRNLIPVLLLTALVTGGGTNPDCEARYVLWGNDANYATVMLSQDSTDQDALRTGYGRKHRWFGDDQSRLIFYSWPSALDGESVSTIRSQANAVTARRSTWPTVITNVNDGYADATLPIPCDAYGCGTDWAHVKSIDIGHCSIFIPHQPDPAGASQYIIDSSLQNLSFGQLLLDKLLEEIDGREEEAQGATIYLRITDPLASSWWISTDNYQDELCLDIHAEARITRGVNCGWQPVRFGVCGLVAADSTQQLVWNATRSAGWRSSAGTFICRNRREQVVNSVLSYLTRDVSSSEGHNEITLALRRETAEMVLEREDLIKSSPWFGAIPPSCNNPLPTYETPHYDCTWGVLRTLNGYCFSNDPDATTGVCRYPIPIERVEHEPQGIELIVAEQYKEENLKRLALLLSLASLEDTSDETEQSDFATLHCSAPQGATVDIGSRKHERQGMRFRRISHNFRASPWSSLD